MSAAPSFRKSAAVMVVRSTDRGAEVLLVQRNPKLRFFGGYWAFPGGVADRMPDGGREDFLTCAARELFEETGLHFAPELRALSPAHRTALRRRLLEEEGSVARPTVAWHVDAPLQPLGQLRTPAFAPIRYRTQFYRCDLPPGQEPEIWPGELAAAEFVGVEKVLAQWRRGERLIVPPVRTLLECWHEAGAVAFAEHARVRCEAFESGAIAPIMNSPGICMIPLRTPTVPPATTTNHYLVGHERLVLIDPGTPYPEEQARLMGFLDERIARGARFEALVLTHRHHDHVAAVPALERRYRVPVLAHADTLAQLPFAVQRPVECHDGQRIELGAAPDGSPHWALVALHTPGHAAGHFVFRDTRYGAMLGGDLASTMSTIVIEPPEGHLATYLDSLQRAIDAKPGLFYPAHGPVARDGVALLRGYLQHRRVREERLVALLADRAWEDEQELVEAVYTDVAPEVHGLALHSLRAGLIKLEEEGRARRGERGWVGVGEGAA